MRTSLRALAALLAYPTPELHAALPEIGRRAPDEAAGRAIPPWPRRCPG